MFGCSAVQSVRLLGEEALEHVLKIAVVTVTAVMDNFVVAMGVVVCVCHLL